MRMLCQDNNFYRWALASVLQGCFDYQTKDAEWSRGSNDALLFSHYSGSEACAWVRRSTDASAAGPLPAFSFYSQTAHLCVFDVTHTHTRTQKSTAQPQSFDDSYIISQTSSAILLLSFSVTVCQIVTLPPVWRKWKPHTHSTHCCWHNYT